MTANITVWTTTPTAHLHTHISSAAKGHRGPDYHHRLPWKLARVRGSCGTNRKLQWQWWTHTGGRSPRRPVSALGLWASAALKCVSSTCTLVAAPPWHLTHTYIHTHTHTASTVKFLLHEKTKKRAKKPKRHNTPFTMINKHNEHKLIIKGFIDQLNVNDCCI